jgi:hypothetical protein
MKISLSLIALASALLLTSGCSNLRFYQARSQFYKFSKNIDVEADDALVLKFKSPVLRATDLIRLFGHQPTKSESRENGSALLVGFKNECDEKIVISFTFSLNASGRLDAIQIPKRFLFVFPDACMIGIINKNVVSESYEADWVPLVKKVDSDLLKQWLGRPFADATEGNKHVITYHFRREKCQEDKTDNPICVIKYIFGENGFGSIDANLEGLKICIN